MDMKLYEKSAKSYTIYFHMKEQRTTHINRVVAVTGFDDEKEKENSLKAGFDAFICKPLRLDGIIEVMKHLY
jgi:CheY-like chemotaxis protein